MRNRSSRGVTLRTSGSPGSSVAAKDNNSDKDFIPSSSDALISTPPPTAVRVDAPPGPDPPAGTVWNAGSECAYDTRQLIDPELLQLSSPDRPPGGIASAALGTADLYDTFGPLDSPQAGLMNVESTEFGDESSTNLLDHNDSSHYYSRPIGSLDVASAQDAVETQSFRWDPAMQDITMNVFGGNTSVLQLPDLGSSDPEEDSLASEDAGDNTPLNHQLGLCECGRRVGLLLVPKRKAPLADIDSNVADPGIVDLNEAAQCAGTQPKQWMQLYLRNQLNLLDIDDLLFVCSTDPNFGLSSHRVILRFWLDETTEWGPDWTCIERGIMPTMRFLRLSEESDLKLIYKIDQKNLTKIRKLVEASNALVPTSAGPATLSAANEGSDAIAGAERDAQVSTNVNPDSSSKTARDAVPEGTLKATQEPVPNTALTAVENAEVGTALAMRPDSSTNPNSLQDAASDGDSQTTEATSDDSPATKPCAPPASSDAETPIASSDTSSDTRPSTSSSASPGVNTAVPDGAASSPVSSTNASLAKNSERATAKSEGSTSHSGARATITPVEAADSALQEQPITVFTAPEAYAPPPNNCTNRRCVAKSKFNLIQLLNILDIDLKECVERTSAAAPPPTPPPPTKTGKIRKVGTGRRLRRYTTGDFRHP